MRNEANLVNVINHGNEALEADFKCDCGNDVFEILHSGKQHNSIFGSTTISKRKGQLIIQCSCSKCLKKFTLYDSTKDGAKPKGTPIEEFCSMEIKKEKLFQINLKYNFYEENFMTDKFEMFFMDVKKPNSNKYLRICEE